MKDVAIGGYQPGAIGRVTQLHAAYYHQQWGFDLYFEAKVARELAGFLERFDEKRGDAFWAAREKAEGRLVGSITIDGSEPRSEAGAEKRREDGAHLRWFIVAHEAHGQGLGGRLMEAAMTHCERAGFRRVYLWTFAGLDAARHLYERHGFRLAEEHEGDQWGSTVTEQRFELTL